MNADRANEAMMEADEVGVAELAQHRDDEIDHSDDDDEEEDDAVDDVTDSSSEDEEEEPVIPTPEEVELEYTFPQDFQGRSWQDVVQRRYFHLIIDPSCTGIPTWKFEDCEYLIEIVYPEGKDRTSELLRIGRSAFEHCGNLQRMNKFPVGLIELGFSTFFGCSNLQGRITIPSSIRFVRGVCFAYCNAITSVVFESSTGGTGG